MIATRRRLFVLLGAYEDLTERESSALRRGDIDYVLSIQERKGRLTDALREARDSTELSSGESATWNDRVRSLHALETTNLEILRGHMAEVQESLRGIGQAAQRSRVVRRGYSQATGRLSGTGILGSA